MQQLSMFLKHVYPNANDSFSPLIFNLKNNKEQEEFRRFLDDCRHIKVYDTIHQQIGELIKLRNPAQKYATEHLYREIDTYINNTPTDMIGNWCYYPWSYHLVHLLPEEEFIEVRTNRNKLKITAEEQTLLSQKTMGVIGLSVGQSVALTAVLERVCGRIRIADFDTLDLSNLNRLRTGLHHLGIKKTLIAAREIAEIDPYIKVEVFDQGITSDNIESFITGLDVLVEVCDSLDIKIMSRQKARALNIPVVMDTNDRGMVDIERFDLEPNRPLLHGLISDEDCKNIGSLSPEERLKFVSKIISLADTSAALKKSMAEINKTITSWPQLASSVVLGGAATTDAVRKILLKQSTVSGRFYIDFDELLINN